MPPGILRRCLPFSAIKGADDAKNALKCIAIDDSLTGLLIKGPAGTAKSMLVRSFIDMLPGKNMVNVPQNVTDEQLFGGLDLEEAIRLGRTSVKGGLLQRADGNILYLDNVNLFDPRMLSSIMECAESGRVVVEREGISAEYICRTTVVATMDPAEQILPDHIADRFDMCVQTYSAEDVSERFDIVNANLEFDMDPDGFISRYSEEDSNILSGIEAARGILNEVIISRKDIRKISAVCRDLNVKGHRADISVAKVSRVLAAIEGKNAVSDINIKDAAVLCLLHRRKDPANGRRPLQIQKADAPVPEDTHPVSQDIPDEDRAGEEVAEEHPDQTMDAEPEETEDLGTVAEITDSVKERLESMDSAEAVRLHRIAGKAGRRKNITISKRTGRYRGFRIPSGRSVDPAFDATVRAAAPYQRTRESKGLSINIKPQDIREKIRIKKDSCSFLFAVDVSGSLVKSGMMQDIKNGVKAMLMDSYVQRDKVALLTFRMGEVRISVPFTRSVEGVCDILENTVTGDGTPLGAAMLLIREYMLNYVRKNPEEKCYVILITDGEATYPVIRGREASIELKKVAATMNIPNTEWIVVDSSLIPGKINHALNLSNMLGARYVRLEDLRLL
ncbi:MAG: ATP-binding protein [Candidatus Methanoplasma sp.]|jgi:magnesium chelatase subunit D|nr:ATP-binding protein [Candidatus Methanoplasma sp.]